MFHSGITFVAAVLVVLPSICNSNPLPDSVGTASHPPFGCKYVVKSNSSFARALIYPNGIYEAPTVEQCQLHCDRDGGCVAAQWKPQVNRDDQNCLVSHKFGFEREEVKPSTTKTVIQLVPNSCDKPAATPTPFVCEPHITTMKDGCKYNVTCNEITHGFAEVTGTRTPGSCAQELLFDTNSAAMSWYQGGECQINDSEHYRKFKTFPYKNALTWQIIKNSCKKKSAKPKKSGGGGGG